MQALPLAESGTCSITAGENTASVHQHRSGVLSVALANSIAQTLGLWQIGQRVGSTFSIVNTKAGIVYKVFHFLSSSQPVRRKVLSKFVLAMYSGTAGMF
jgi:hypothetical protein